MEIATLVSVLDQPQLAAEYLQGWGLRDVGRGQQILVELAESGLTLDLLAEVCRQLAEHLPGTFDPDLALDSFRRYLLAVRGPLGLAALLERDASAMPMLLAALSLGPKWTQLLCSDPEAFDLLRQTEGQPIGLATLLADVLAEVEAFRDERSIVVALARIRGRHLLRIAYGEIVADGGVEIAQAQLTQLAEVLIEAALAAALRKSPELKLSLRMGAPRQPRSCVIAVGELGASEASYALRLELLVLYEAAEQDAAGLRGLHEYFDRVAKTVGRMINEAVGNGASETVKWIKLPDSPYSACAHSMEDVIVGFDSFGRTWHRQEMLKARSVAGDRELGQSMVARLETWLFRRYLGRADETGIKALKRRILMDATLHQDDWRNVEVSRGGLKDIERSVGFLQLLAGGEQPAVREPNILAAMEGLEGGGIVTPEERTVLQDSYVFLRRLQHRLQVLVNCDARELPADGAQVARIAAGLGLPSKVDAMEAELKQRLDRTWQTLRKLLTSAFAEEPPMPREVELLLDPDPAPEEVRAALAPFGFEQPEQALATLNELATEQVPFLSTRRCRHLLAGILPKVLCAVGATPIPDRTLDHLSRVSNSLGGKGVLWDLFRSNEPSLDLYVRLCAARGYLSELLTTNPGMIDELVDSLQLDHLPTRASLSATLAELCRGASDTLVVLHDFKNAEHLRIGVRDILGKEDIDRTHEALADVAETCLAHVAELEFARLVEKYGVPTIGPGPFEGESSQFVIVGLGKLGGREPNYHSHLDVMFLYEAEGTTRPQGHSRRQERTANNFFFTQLAQRIIKQLAEHTPKGRLYAVDALLRPIGVGGALALPFTDFAQHFQSGAAPLWQWQVLCQARPVFGEATARERAANLIRELLVGRQSSEGDRLEIRRMRMQLERGASANNLKRGPGGTLDVEFIVQMLQLKQGAASPSVLTTNTQSALGALATAGALKEDVAQRLGDSYRFLRRVESGLRLLDTSARHDLPEAQAELAQLALLLGHSNPERLRQQCLEAMVENRGQFEALTSQ